jgi:ELWxxDGT repeat protein
MNAGRAVFRRGVCRIAAALAVLMGAARHASAQTPVLVKDICHESTADSDPTDFTALGNQVLFFTADWDGKRLWRTDGTLSGTVKLNDAPCPVMRVLGVDAAEMLYLCSYNMSWSEVWRSDGTAFGTYVTGRTIVTPTHVVAEAHLAGAHYLALDAKGGGTVLWRRDGQQLSKVATIASPGSLPSQVFLAAAGSRLLLAGDDGIHGLELWSSDGTAAGTSQVRDIEPGEEGSVPRTPAYVASRGLLFFVACTRKTGCQLWASDGTAAGTRQVTTFADGPDSNSAPSGLTALDGVVLFGAPVPGGGRALWRSDGTAAGTVVLRTDFPEFEPIATLGNRLVFRATSSAHGRELWISDGSAAGTQMIADLNPTGDTHVLPPALEWNGRLLVALAANTGWNELWSTDGTAAGTQRVTAADGSTVVNPRLGTEAGGTLVFTAYTAQHGYEPWRLDAGPSSARILRDLNEANGGSLPYALTAGSNLLYFIVSGCNEHRLPSLWRSDGSDAGTFRLRDFYTMGQGYLVKNGGGVSFFADDGESGLAVWSSDGTVAGTRRLVGDELRGHELDPNTLFHRNGADYFFARDASARIRLWRVTAVPRETAVVWDGVENAAANETGWLTTAGGRILFATFVDGLATLWSSGGTPGSERLLASPQMGLIIDRVGPAPVSFGELAFFVARDEAHGYELWRTDGTSEGTFMVKDIWPGPGGNSSAPHAMNTIHGRFVFHADDGEHGRELWTSDGTAAGTRMLADIRPGSGSSWPGSDRGILEGPANDAYFEAWVPALGSQLWRSDVSTGATSLVSELAPYPDSIQLMDGVRVGDSFYFSYRCAPGFNLDCPREPRLAVTRGDAASTHRIWPYQSINLGWPRGFLERVGGCAYYSGFHPHFNLELFKVCEGAPRAPRQRLLQHRSELSPPAGAAEPRAVVRP